MQVLDLRLLVVVLNAHDEEAGLASRPLRLAADKVTEDKEGV